MENIKVSVLIYVLNDVTHIEKCIHSVRNQTMQELEILVIDGGSTDGTLEIIKKERKLDPRIRIISCGSGVGLQFNTGLKEARGEYIGICESDDYLLPDMYEKQYEIAKEHCLDFLKANINRFCEAGNKEIYFPFTLSMDKSVYGTLLNGKEDLRVLKLGVNGFWSGLYQREFLLKNKIFMNETQGASYQDITISFLTAIKAERVMLMQESFYCYRMDNPNSSVNNPRKMEILMEEYNLLKKRLKQEGIFETYKEWYFAWRVNGHLWMYDNLAKELKKEYIGLMYQDICDELETGQFQGSELLPKEKKAVEQVKISEMALFTYMEENDAVIENMRINLSQIEENQKIIIFGCGNLGKLVSVYMATIKRKIAAYIDNAKYLWGKKEEDILILSPEQSVEKFPEGIYIVANMAHAHEMKEQLTRLAVPEQHIILCDHYDIFLKNILIQTLKEKAIS